MDTKQCVKCKRILLVEYFSKKKSEKDGLRGYCKDCAKIYKRNWVENNQEHIKTYKYNYYNNNKDLINSKRKLKYSKNKIHYKKYAEEYRIKNRDKIKIYNKKYYEKYYPLNKDKIILAVKNYQQMHKDKVKVYKLKNKYIRKKLINKCDFNYTADDFIKCIDSFNHECAYCGKITNLTQDHVIPITKDGEHKPSNIVPACSSCNSSKNNKLINTWYPKQLFFDKKRLKKIEEYLSTR